MIEAPPPIRPLARIVEATLSRRLAPKRCRENEELSLTGCRVIESETSELMTRVAEDWMVEMRFR